MDAKKAERIAKALGDPYRLKIMEMVKRENDWLPCCAIIGKIELAQSTVSHHMKQLIDADLLIAVKDGRNAQYQVNKEVMREYLEFLNVFTV